MFQTVRILYKCQGFVCFFVSLNYKKIHFTSFKASHFEPIQANIVYSHISHSSADVRHAQIAVIIMFFIPADDNIRSYWWILGTSDWEEQRTRSSTLFTLHKKTPGRGNSVRHKSNLREKCSLSNTSDNYPRNKHRTCSVFLPHFSSTFTFSVGLCMTFTHVF